MGDVLFLTQRGYT